MTFEHLQAILKNLQIKSEKDGAYNLPEGSALTFYLAHDGVGMSVPRVESVRVEGEIIYVRSTKKELFALACGDVYALALDGPPGQPARRAGFG